MSSREQIQMKEESQDQQDQQRQGCTAAEVLVKCLEKEGVKYAFGIPGEENLDMMNALEKSSIRVVVVRHEQGAAFMADMYGRLTGKAGVCFSTLWLQCEKSITPRQLPYKQDSYGNIKKYFAESNHVCLIF